MFHLNVLERKNPAPWATAISRSLLFKFIASLSVKELAWQRARFVIKEYLWYSDGGLYLYICRWEETDKEEPGYCNVLINSEAWNFCSFFSLTGYDIITQHWYNSTLNREIEGSVLNVYGYRYNLVTDLTKECVGEWSQFVRIKKPDRPLIAMSSEWSCEGRLTRALDDIQGTVFYSKCRVYLYLPIPKLD